MDLLFVLQAMMLQLITAVGALSGTAISLLAEGTGMKYFIFVTFFHILLYDYCLSIT